MGKGTCVGSPGVGHRGQLGTEANARPSPVPCSFIVSTAPPQKHTYTHTPGVVAQDGLLDGGEGGHGVGVGGAQRLRDLLILRQEAGNTPGGRDVHEEGGRRSGLEPLRRVLLLSLSQSSLAPRPQRKHEQAAPRPRSGTQSLRRAAPHHDAKAQQILGGDLQCLRRLPGNIETEDSSGVGGEGSEAWERSPVEEQGQCRRCQRDSVLPQHAPRCSSWARRGCRYTPCPHITRSTPLP
jgi:hypothetical protein